MDKAEKVSATENSLTCPHFSSLFSSAHYVVDFLWLSGKLADNDYFFAEPKTFTWKSGKLTLKNRLT